MAYGVTPTINSPTSGSMLAGATDTFTWQDNGASVSNYWLDAGSSVGANDYFNSGNLGSSTSVLALNLPSDGSSTVYVRLWYRLNGTGPWLFVDETYTAGTGGATLPTITNPTPPGPFTDPTGNEIFTWSENGSGATEYWVYAGPIQGSPLFFDSANVGNALTVTITGLPIDGSSVWVRLWYRSGGSGVWSFIDEQFTALSAAPTIDSSTGTGVLTSPTDAFTWTDPSGNVTDWWLYVGSTVGGYELEDSANLGSATSYLTTNGNLPTSSVPVYVRLWHRAGAAANWQFEDAVFTSAP